MIDIYIPLDSEEITPEWLDLCLRQGGVITGNNAVKAITLSESLTHKGFMSHVLYLSVAYATPTESTPTSLIVKLSSKDPEMRAAGKKNKFYEREVMAYQHIAPVASIKTAHCYYSALDKESGKHVLILENLSYARNGDRRVGCSAEDAELAMRSLAKFHAAWWDSPKLDALAWLPNHTDIYRQETVLPTFTAAWPNFVRKVGDLLPQSLRVDGEQLAQHMVFLTDYLFCGTRNKTLVHFDYQLDNLFFPISQEERLPIVIDWQLLTYGRGSVDVAYFLGQNLAADERKRCESDLLQLYHQTLIDNGVRDYSFEELRHDYKSALLFHLLGLVFTVGGETFSPRQEALLLEKVLPRNIAALVDAA